MLSCLDTWGSAHRILCLSARWRCAELVFLCWKQCTTSWSIPFSSCPSSYGVICIDTKSFTCLLISVWMCFTGARSWQLGALRLRNGMSSEVGAFSSEMSSQGWSCTRSRWSYSGKASPLCCRCTFHQGARSCLGLLMPPAVAD